jgi:catechol 2,3-dioxygenase-like lactoylglutathione lyase family enzyme
MKFVSPLILVEDIQRSREFYEKTLKQKVKYDFGENVSFEGDFAIHLKSHFEKVAKIKNPRSVFFGSNSFELYFETEKIEEIHSELQHKKVEFLHEIEEQPWGQRVFRFYDPDQHIVEIGEILEALVIRLYKQGYSLDAIVKKTGMPDDFVEDTIRAQ